MAYNVYSHPDCQFTLYHPDVGTCYLHTAGVDKVVVSAAGDLTNHTTTADGYIVVNKLKTTNGEVAISVPQNSVSDNFIRRWIRYAKNPGNPNRVALGTLSIFDGASGFSTVCTGLSLKKMPDRTWDRTATNITYEFLATTITEQ